MRILVTGGCGWLGKKLCTQLALLGHDVIALDRNGSCNGSENFSKVEGDITGNLSPVDFGYLDVVYHLAAVSRVVDAVKDPNRAVFVNVIGTRNVVRLARDCGAKRFIFASSREVYGDAEVDVRETSRKSPVNMYGTTKYAAEQLLKEVADMHVTALRITNLYGAGKRDRVIPIFVKNALENEPLIVNGDKVLDFLYIGDAVDVLVNCMEAEHYFPFALNVGGGISYDLKDLAETIIARFSSKSQIHFGEAFNFEVKKFHVDVSEAQKLIGLPKREDPLFKLDEVAEYVK